MDRVSPNLHAFIQLPKEALFAVRSLTTLHFGKKRKKARFSNCVGCFTTLFSVSGVSETEMVSSGAVDASMMGCSTPHDN